MKIASFFSGAGGMDLGFEQAGHEIVFATDCDKYCKQTYDANFKVPLTLVDFNELKPEDIPDADIWIGGPPCFAGGTLILTENGYTEVENVKVGDKVLTHLGRWKKVTNIMKRENAETYKIVVGGNPIVTTAEHPFYVRKKSRVWNNNRRSYDRQFDEPRWIEAKDVTKNCFFGQVLPPEVEDNHSKEFWFIVGRYLACGWFRKRKDRRTDCGSVCISCHHDSVEFLMEQIKIAGFKSSPTKERTATKIWIHNTELYQFLQQFGHGAANKFIPAKYLSLNKEKSTALLHGYISGDGSVMRRPDGYSATTVSRKLALSVVLLAQKVFGVVASCYYTKRPPTCIIEGRLVNQKDTYKIQIPFKNKTHFVEGYYGWKMPTKQPVVTGEKATVYNISVEEDESYIAEGVITHNCQDFSIAGKGAGIEGERGSLINKYVDLIGEKKPKWVVIENVKGLIFKKHKQAFDALCKRLTEFGYIVNWKVLNSKDFGVPQNRNRVFIIAGPREFVFPDGEDLTKCLADVMDDEVDEKYYLSEKAKIRLKNEPKKDPTDTANTLLAGYYKQGFHHNYIKLIGKTTDRETPKNNPLHPDERIYDGYGISTAVTGVSSQHPYVLKPQKIGWMGNDGVISQGGLLNRVYDGYGIAPTTISSGGRLVQIGNIEEPAHYPRQKVYDGYGVACTVTTNGKNGMAYYTTPRIRRLTPRECARLQGFPEDFVFPVSDTQIYKQCGNAVTVSVAKAIGRGLK